MARTSHGCSDASAASCSSRSCAGTPCSHPFPTGALSCRSTWARSPPATARSTDGVRGRSLRRGVAIESATSHPYHARSRRTQATRRAARHVSLKDVGEEPTGTRLSAALRGLHNRLERCPLFGLDSAAAAPAPRPKLGSGGDRSGRVSLRRMASRADRLGGWAFTKGSGRGVKPTVPPSRRVRVRVWELLAPPRAQHLATKRVLLCTRSSTWRLRAERERASTSVCESAGDAGASVGVVEQSPGVNGGRTGARGRRHGRAHCAIASTIPARGGVNTSIAVQPSGPAWPP